MLIPKFFSWINKRICLLPIPKNFVNKQKYLVYFLCRQFWKYFRKSSYRQCCFCYNTVIEVIVFQKVSIFKLFLSDCITVIFFVYFFSHVFKQKLLYFRHTTFNFAMFYFSWCILGNLCRHLKGLIVFFHNLHFDILAWLGEAAIFFFF